MATRFLYLVRHGNYNAYVTIEDDLGGPLTALGEQQAVYTGQYLSQQPIRHIYTSVLRRAAQTTEVISKFMPNIPVSEREDLREVTPGIPARLEDNFAERFPEMTSDRLRAGQDRADAAFSAFFQPPAQPDTEDEVHDVLVCHGNLIRYLICRTLNVSGSAWGNMIIHQGSISRIMIDDADGIYLMTFNEVVHMPPDIWVY